MRKALCTMLLAVIAAAVGAPAAPAQTPAEEPRIRAGVTVSGVDVGTLTVAEATAKLEAELGPALAGDVTVTVARRRFTLEMAAIDYDFRADRTALRALYAGQAAAPLPDGTLPPASAEPSVAYKRAPVWGFVRRVARRVDVAPRDARLKIKLTRMVKKRSHKGHKLRVRALVKAIGVPLADPLAARALRPGRDTIDPKVRTRELKRLYPKVITIDRAHFRLRLFKRLHFLKGYGVAVGMPAYPTPTGLFAIQSKQVNPTWTAPNSPWAGEMAGQQIAGGAWNNPLRARWMGVDGSVGIHGTGQPWTVGSRASHGCIRMTVPAVIDLFRRVSVGTPVLIR